MDGHTPEYNFTYSGIGVEEIQTFKDSVIYHARFSTVITEMTQANEGEA